LKLSLCGYLDEGRRSGKIWGGINFLSGLLPRQQCQQDSSDRRLQHFKSRRIGGRGWPEGEPLGPCGLHCSAQVSDVRRPTCIVRGRMRRGHRRKGRKENPEKRHTTKNGNKRERFDVSGTWTTKKEGSLRQGRTGQIGKGKGPFVRKARPKIQRTHSSQYEERGPAALAQGAAHHPEQQKQKVCKGKRKKRGAELPRGPFTVQRGSQYVNPKGEFPLH